MKIVHITQFFHPERGYQENHLSILQKRDGHEVTIICTDDLTLWGIDKTTMQQMDKEFTEKHHIEIIRLHKVFEFSTRIFVKGLKKVLDDSEADLLIIHAVSLPMSLRAMKWGTKNKIKMIVDDHMVEAGSFNKSAKYFYSIFKRIFPLYLKFFNIKIDKWIAVSDETKQFMLKNYGIKDTIHVVPLGYDDNSVYKDIKGGKRWLKSHNLPIDIPFILYIGKFDDMKDPIDLLEPFKLFKKENPNYKLLMVGDPSESYQSKLEKKINDLQIANDVFITAAISNNQIRKVFSIAEMVIWPHGSSMAMLEAMACECPVVAPDIDVNQERLSNERGIMFNENDILNLVDKMNNGLVNKSKLTSNAKKWVSNYTWHSLSNNFLD